MNKNKIIKILTIRIAYHIYFWAFIFFVLSLEPRGEEISYLNVMIYNLRIVGLALIPVYTHFYIFEKFVSRKRYGIYAVLSITIIIIFGIINNIVLSRVFHVENTILGSIFFIGSFIIMTTVLKLAKAGFVQRLTLQEIKAEHLHTELELLKSQINPHFLFNTLNNLFGLVRKLDETIASGIAQLSHIMRYMIHESNVDKIELTKEVEQIHRLIELQKLRFSKDDDVTIHFKIEGDLKEVQIPPMLLIPFIENSFKHGISLDESSFIEIYLISETQRLVFTVRNTIHNRRKQIKPAEFGMGLKNVQRRLELLYPSKHRLDIQQSDNTFKIELILEL